MQHMQIRENLINNLKDSLFKDEETVSEERQKDFTHLALL
jgi:purine-nucleoside phosphorylase